MRIKKAVDIVKQNDPVEEVSDGRIRQDIERSSDAAVVEETQESPMQQSLEHRLDAHESSEEAVTDDQLISGSHTNKKFRDVSKPEEEMTAIERQILQVRDSTQRQNSVRETTDCSSIQTEKGLVKRIIGRLFNLKI